MPPKNSKKIYAESSYYHIFNRGVGKQIVFGDDQDYKVFLSFLKQYLSYKDETSLREIIHDKSQSLQKREKARNLLRMKNFADQVELIAYCLMPNHFHLQIYQHPADAIEQFMKSLTTKYVMYFNQRYNRVGPLFQGVYKAVRVTTDAQLAYLSSYIHRNPNNLIGAKSLESYTYSSYPAYIRSQNPTWVKTTHILQNFKSPSQYQQFVLDDLKVNKLEPNLILD